MRVIYEPNGAAKEYSPLAANIYRGCSHGCSYCYVPGTIRMSREDFSRPAPRTGILDGLLKDARKFAGDERNVLLSFTSDLYQPCETEYKLARQVISILNEHDIAVTVLTKGGMMPVKDFDLLSQNSQNEFAVTLTANTEELSKKWEPNAPVPLERIQGVYEAAERGIKTWVSFEPVISPDAVYDLLDFMGDIPDEFRVGKLNHHSFSGSIDWPKFRERVTAILEDIGKPFMIKKDLKNAK